VAFSGNCGRSFDPVRDHLNLREEMPQETKERVR